MQKWEYKTESMYVHKDPATHKPGQWVIPFDLGKLGKEGWELINILPMSSYHTEGSSTYTSEIWFYYKRPISE